MTPYFYMFIAIGLEIISTSALKASDGMTRLGPSLLAIIGYPLCFWSLSISLKTLPVGIVYAIWSGVGIIGIALIGMYYYNETLSAYSLIGISLILVGVLLLMLVS